jgi:hypothetical protein
MVSHDMNNNFINQYAKRKIAFCFCFNLTRFRPLTMTVISIEDGADSLWAGYKG